MFSIYSFPRKHLARTLYGDDSKSNVRRIDALLDGESRMTVDLFWALSRLEPLLDINRSLKDMYERYEIANLRKHRNPKPPPGKPEVENHE